MLLCVGKMFFICLHFSPLSVIDTNRRSIEITITDLTPFISLIVHCSLGNGWAGAEEELEQNNPVRR